MENNFLAKQNNWIPIYTIVCILNKMRHELGLEATLEYIEKYKMTIEENNPKLKFAVDKALAMMSVEKMYKDAMR